MYVCMYVCVYAELMTISISLVDVTVVDLWENKQTNKQQQQQQQQQHNNNNNNNVHVYK